MQICFLIVANQFIFSLKKKKGKSFSIRIISSFFFFFFQYSNIYKHLLACQAQDSDHTSIFTHFNVTCLPSPRNQSTLMKTIHINLIFYISWASYSTTSSINNNGFIRFFTNPTHFRSLCQPRTHKKLRQFLHTSTGIHTGHRRLLRSSQSDSRRHQGYSH